MNTSGSLDSIMAPLAVSKHTAWASMHELFLRIGSEHRICRLVLLKVVVGAA